MSLSGPAALSHHHQHDHPHYQQHHHDHLVRASFRTPLGSFCAQVLITQTVILGVQRVSNGQERFFEEFLCTLQTAILSKELDIIWTAYGTLAYAAGMFCVGVMYSLTFRKGVFSNPVSTIHLFTTHGRMSEIAELVVHIGVQTFAAVVSEKYVFMLWSSRVFNSGLAVAQIEAPCESELQVPVIVGFLVEGFATFVLRLMYHAPRGGLDEIMLCSFAGVVISLAAYPFTGGYCNPSSAFASQFDCPGHQHWEFFAVYVLSPVTAAYMVGKYGDQVWRWLLPNRHRSLPGPPSNPLHDVSSHDFEHSRTIRHRGQRREHQHRNQNRQ